MHTDERAVVQMRYVKFLFISVRAIGLTGVLFVYTGEHLKHLAEAATLEERAESETRTSSSSESVSTPGSDGNVPGSSPLSPAMLAEGIRSGRQSRPSHEKNSDDQSNKSLWDVDDQHVTRGILEEGKLNALLRLLAAHRQLLRQKRSESQNGSWDDFIDETCVATSLTRNELLHKVKKWEVNAGELIFIYVRAIRMIDVVFCSQGSCSNARCARWSRRRWWTCLCC